MQQASLDATGLIVLRLGERAPWGRLGFENGGAITLGPGGIELRLCLADPLQSEIAAMRRGKLRVGLHEHGDHGMLVWEFSGGSHGPVCLDTPFHVARDPNVEGRRLPHRESYLHRAVHITLQDQDAKLYAIRYVTLPPLFCCELDRLVARQADDPRPAHVVTAEHAKVVASWYQKFPSPSSLMRKALLVATAGEDDHIGQPQGLAH
jgi:hypothetical protein